MLSHYQIHFPPLPRRTTRYYLPQLPLQLDADYYYQNGIESAVLLHVFSLSG